jgi:hypothetical protein
MFMEERIVARPLPRDSIIMEAKEVQEVKEVRKATHGKMLARGGEQKVCYDANQRIGIVRKKKRRLPPTQ